MNHMPAVRAMVESRGEFEVTQELKWKTKHAQYEFQLPVSNSLGLPLILGGIVNRSTRPYYGSIWVRNKLDTDCHVIRMCLRGLHKNKRSVDKTHWNPGTHIHHWNSVDSMNYAKDPSCPPWPPVEWVENSRQPLINSDYREALITFCSMHSIRFDVDVLWTDIPFELSTPYVVSPIGEEIP